MGVVHSIVGSVLEGQCQSSCNPVEGGESDGLHACFESSSSHYVECSWSTRERSKGCNLLYRRRGPARESSPCVLAVEVAGDVFQSCQIRDSVRDHSCASCLTQSIAAR